nr:M50 family metallopeptidase [uncultured Agathobaculum sp.]
MTHGRIEIRDGFVVLLAALWCADRTNVLPLVLLAAAVHEGGHLLVLCLSGGRLHRLTLTCCGAVLHCTLPEGRFARAAVCLAGPAASFALTALAQACGWYRLAGASVLLGAFNLLPMPPLDGGMALEHLCAGGAETVRMTFAALSAAGLLFCGLWLLRVGGGCWLLLIGTLIGAKSAKNLANSVNMM